MNTKKQNFLISRIDYFKYKMGAVQQCRITTVLVIKTLFNSAKNDLETTVFNQPKSLTSKLIKWDEAGKVKNSHF